MITSAACEATIQGEKVVIKCHRHCDFFELLHTLHLPYDRASVRQGFIYWNGTTEQFVDRITAARIAYECGQISQPLHILYSEDLY